MFGFPVVVGTANSPGRGRQEKAPLNLIVVVAYYKCIRRFSFSLSLLFWNVVPLDRHSFAFSLSCANKMATKRPVCRVGWLGEQVSSRISNPIRSTSAG